MNKKWISLLFLGLTLLVITACGSDTEENNGETDMQEESSSLDENEGEGEEVAEMPEIPEPDLDSVPDIVAQVNGMEITKKEFNPIFEGQYQQMVMQSQMTGQEFDEEELKRQVVDSLIGQELLIQEANNRNYSVSDTETNKILDDLIALNGLQSKEEFLSALKQQGMEEEDVMSQLELQVKVDKLIAEVSGGIDPTEEELEEAYAQISAHQEQMGTEEELPPFADLKSDLEAELKRQKQAEASQSIVKDLREEADVTINL